MNRGSLDEDAAARQRALFTDQGVPVAMELLIVTRERQVRASGRKPELAQVPFKRARLVEVCAGLYVPSHMLTLAL